MSRYLITPVEEVKASFYCSHCRLLIRDAVQNHEGFRLCQECCDEIKRLPETQCADCGVSIPPGSEVYPDKAARREIAALEVYCPNHPIGCNWTGPLRSLDDHVSQCPHKGVDCPNPGCNVVTTTALLKQHIEECSYRRVECQHCNSLVPFCQLEVHYEEECQHYPQPCRLCGQLVAGKDLEEHMEENCPFVQCKGCNVLVHRETTKEQIDGRNREPHFSDPKITFDHVQRLTAKTEVMKKQIQHIKENSVSDEQFVKLEKKVTMALTTLDVLVSAREDDGVIAMKTLLQEIQRTVTRQNKKIEKQAHDISELTSQLQAHTAPGTLKGPLHDTMTTGHSTYNQLTSEPSNMDGRLMQVMKSVEELQRTTSMMKVHISELELQLQASLASTHTGSFLWRIPEVARRKRDAFEGRITSIYSPPFYSGRNGYKMCIRAYLNGDGIGFNTHLSVFFVLMRGEYDPLLKWPFESKVSLILVDQKLRQHIVQTFKPSPDSSSFQKPRSDMNMASGCPQFAKLSVLDEGNYVQNDVMFLKCIVDTSKIVHP